MRCLRMQLSAPTPFIDCALASYSMRFRRLCDACQIETLWIGKDPCHPETGLVERPLVHGDEISVLLKCRAAPRYVRGCVGQLPELDRTHSEYRAFVVGVTNYEHVDAVPMGIADAMDMAALLHEKGYLVTRVLDASVVDMWAAFLAFAASIETGDTVIVYFAGHGIAWGGRTCLVQADGYYTKAIGTHGRCLLCDCAGMWHVSRWHLVSLLSVSLTLPATHTGVHG